MIFFSFHIVLKMLSSFFLFSKSWNELAGHRLHMTYHPAGVIAYQNQAFNGIDGFRRTKQLVCPTGDSQEFNIGIASR